MKQEDIKYTRQDKYQKSLDYEQILFQQMVHISSCRNSTRDLDIERYQESVNTLIIMLPKKLRVMAQEYKNTHNIDIGLSLHKKQLYDRLWEYINEILEDHNLIFRTSYIKTFE